MANTVVGVISYDARINLTQLRKDASEMERITKSAYDKTQAATNGATNSTNQFTKAQQQQQRALSTSRSSIVGATFAMTALTAATIGAGVAISRSLGDAIARSDTINNFPRVLEAMGGSALEAEASTQKLAERLQGLPTPLQDGTRAVQQFIAAGLPVDVATEGFLALNNAFLASGASTQAAAQSTVQLQQALSRGRIEGEEWNSILANTPTFLQAMINETGKTRDELRELYATSPETLIKDLIRLNVEGGGGLASLDSQARALTDGIGTSFSNLGNAITRSIATIIEAVGRDNITNSITLLGDTIENTANSIASIVTTLQPFAPALTVVAGGLGAATVAMGLLTLATNVASGALTVFRGILTLISRHPIIAVLTALAAVVGAVVTATGVFGDNVEDIEAPAAKIDESISNWQPSINGASDEAGKLAKQMEDIRKKTEEVNEEYRYNLAQLVANKNENIAQLRDQLASEEQAYNNAYKSRFNDFQKNAQKEEVEYGKRTRALQTQIDFLTRYNNQANQRKLQELQFALARENAQYAESTRLREEGFNQETEAAATEYERRRAENQKKLNEELALLEKHREDVLSVRNVILRDEIENLKRSRDEQLKSLQEQQSQIANQGAAAGRAFGQAYKYQLIESTRLSPEEAKKVYSGGTTSASIQTYQRGDGKVERVIVPNFATGGFTGQGGKYETAGIVHKGEYVLPKELVNQSTGQPDFERILGNAGQNINITVSGVFATSPAEQRRVADVIASRLQETQRAKGFA